MARALLAHLGAAGTRVRVAQARPVPPGGARRGLSPLPVRLDLDDRRTWKPAIGDARRIFVAWPLIRHDRARQLLEFLGVAGERGVRRIVGCSIAGATPGMPHHRLERTVEASGVPFVLLRPTPPFQLLLHDWAADIVSRDQLRMPFAHERIAMVDGRDVAEVAVAALGEDTSRTTVGATYTLTGQETLTGDETAACLSRHLDREIEFVPLPFHHYRRELVVSGKPLSLVYAELLENASMRMALSGRVDSALGELLGRAPIGLDEFVRGHREHWHPGATAGQDHPSSHP